MALALPLQPSLFDAGVPAFDPAFGGAERIDLGRGAWIDFIRGWVTGDQAVLEALWSTTDWQALRRWMYERLVDVPRLVASLPENGPGHPLIAEMGAVLARRYGRDLSSVSMAAYRDGRDSVAFHGDRLGRFVHDAIVAIVSLGEPRRFLIRPAGGGASRSFLPGRGDLLVMGGTCQATWQHAVPKVARAGLRISVQFRSAEADEEA